MQQETINGFRLSPQQERLWDLQQAHPIYIAQSVLSMEGALDAAALQEAATQVVDRHEILRTTFQRLPGMQRPVQIVDEHARFSWRTLAADEGEEEEAIESFLEDERHPFAFDGSPLLRLALLTLAPDRHLLAITLPALCADAWTLNNFAGELVRTYETRAERHRTGEEEPLQYVQFSEWQNELLTEEDAEAGRAFWRSQPGSSAALTLPFAAETDAKTGFAPHVWTISLAEKTATQIEAMAAEHDTSPAVVLLAAWQILLWRFTGEADLVVGDSCDGRQHEVLETALGLFARWLPIPAHLAGSLRFHEVMAQAAEARHNAQEWQEYFTWEEAAHSHNGASAPFFRIGFEYEERSQHYRTTDLSVSVHRQQCYVEPFQLMLRGVRTEEGLQLEFHYDSSRVQRDDVQRVARNFVPLLESAVNQPSTPISRLAVLDEADRQHLLVTLNQTAADYPRQKCLHHLFEEQAAETPENGAVVFAEQTLSYTELNARANQLAHYLQKRSVGPDTPVGLCLERSPEMIVGMLGILKAGGAYVPLDPMYPQDRLAYTVRDVGASVLLAQESVLPALPQHDGPVICLDRDWAEIARESAENPQSGTSPENLAYVIYTSGSTGKPKGVMIQHGSVVNLAMALRETVYQGKRQKAKGKREQESGDDARYVIRNSQFATRNSPLRVSLNAPLTFDSSVKQLVQLLFGHALYIVPEETRLRGDALLSFVTDHALDVLDCTPAQLRLLLEAGLADGVEQTPQLALVGGEAIDESVWSTLQASRHTHFYNVYGPTECTVDATVASLPDAPPAPTIGRPLPNVQVYVLDAHLEPVPIHVPGELYIGGAGLARGYVDAPALTAERFVPDPFSSEPGARLYRTGDRAAYLPAGNLRFLGRMDRQIKLRGFRIELGEIEAVLSQHEDVRESVAMVREDTPTDQRLVAYVVPRRKDAVDVADLRSYLRQKLPEYMVPSAFVTLDELPLTRNGKVDRNALPEPESVRPALQANYVAPRTKMEETIAAIWQDVLQVEKVGVDDNFFDLGGHSLLMVRVHTELRTAFDKEISLIDMFRHPTVSALAQHFMEEQDQQPAVEQAQDRAERRKQARTQQRARAMKRRSSG